MTISSIVRKAGPYVGAGTTATFAFAFKVFADSDVEVSEVDSDGNLTTLTLTSEYTVSLNVDQDASPGGSITLVAGNLPVGTSLTISSVVAQLQGTDVQNGGGFFPDVINDSLDKVTILVQQVQEQVDRCIKFPVTDGDVNSELPPASLRENLLFGFSADGSVTAATSIPSGDTVYLRRDGSNYPNNIDFKSINGIQNAAMFSGATMDAKLTAALAALPASGGVIDARNITGAQSFAADFTISKPYVTVLFGVCTVSMGAFRIVVSPGTHGVALSGIGGWGLNGPTGTAAGTTFAYTGSGSAISVGDSSADTFNFVMQDIGIIIGTVSSTGARTGIALNRVPNFQLIRVKTGASVTPTGTQVGVKLDGTGNSTTGEIWGPYLQNGTYGIQMTGTGAQGGNGNTVIGGRINGGSAMTGIRCDAGSENRVYGTDIENCGTAVYDNGTNNKWSVRLESNTVAVNFAGSSGRSSLITNPLGAQTVTDLGSDNTVDAGNRFVIKSNGAWVVNNAADAAVDNIIRAGSAADQQASIAFQNKSGTTQWQVFKGSDGSFHVYDAANAVDVVSKGIAAVSNTNVNASGANTAVVINGGVGAGTGGLALQNGGATPAQVFYINGTGKIAEYGDIATAGNGVASILGATSQKAEIAADTNVLTFTPPAAAGSYRITFTLSLSAANAATLGWTVTYKDSNGNAQAPTNLPLFQQGAAAPALTFTTSAAGNYHAEAIVDVDNSATNIVVKLTFSGTSFAGKASATIERLN